MYIPISHTKIKNANNSAQNSEIQNNKTHA
jgi:hypothetical protein